ncbi:hypothetical protein GOP47_0013882 [Adiantum capillus-veneris]|uniref:Uncharacterized protein n=1 Tax=Adiantum capillus-veneris TaxID=13818 RepID=A0A9D4UPK6_ADICA|nr:hypothetical protein GOP47_0013882 [Adiantum capillus-veneris]
MSTDALCVDEGEGSMVDKFYEEELVSKLDAMFPGYADAYFGEDEMQETGSGASHALLDGELLVCEPYLNGEYCTSEENEEEYQADRVDVYSGHDGAKQVLARLNGLMLVPEKGNWQDVRLDEASGDASRVDVKFCGIPGKPGFGNLVASGGHTK